MDHLDLQRLSVAPRLTRRQIKGIFNQLSSISKVSRPIDEHNGWKVSYVSGSSFTENKRGFPCSPLVQPIIFGALGHSGGIKHDKYGFFLSPIQANDILIRGFKTNRNVKAENNRNPTFAGRFRTWIGLSKYVVSLKKNYFNKFLKQNKDIIIIFFLSIIFKEDKPKTGPEHASLESLKNILNNPDVNIDDKERVKVAFAEGYIAGNDRNMPGRGFKWLRLIQHITVTIVGFIVLFLFLGVYKC